jgi:hemerythrin superfamily protein
MSDGRETISEAIGYDHKSFDIYYDKIKAATDLDEKIRWRNQLTWNLARHAISEELTLYPAMIKYLGAEGKALTDTDYAQHQEVCLTSDEQVIECMNEQQLTSICLGQRSSL